MVEQCMVTTMPYIHTASYTVLQCVPVSYITCPTVTLSYSALHCPSVLYTCPTVSQCPIYMSYSVLYMSYTVPVSYILVYSVLQCSVLNQRNGYEVLTMK